jgi:2-dehydro-3-deoxyphosphogalactonate aldolase
MSTQSPTRLFDAALSAMPIIAILRGIRPEESAEVAEAILAGGISIIEVPLNSPEALRSIGIIARAVADRAVVGAGTVLSAGEVSSACDAGASLILSPNMTPSVIEATRRRQCVSIPGIMTPSEAFSALDAGATALKLFPGELITPAAVHALAAVLPHGTRMILVGGVNADSFACYADAPLAGFGIGSSLFKPGLAARDVGERATRLAAAFRARGA